MSLLSLESASALVGQHRQDHAGDAVAPPTIPRRVMQFWDKAPPEQIQTLLERTRSLCAGIGVEHVLFDEVGARAYLADHGDREALRAFDIAVHPAMKCDVFRLAYLYFSGGHYVDADIVLRSNLERLFNLPGDLLVYQWDTQGLSNLCNWLIGGRAGDPTLLSALQATSRNVLSACERDPQAALKNILGVSGPGIFTRGVATDLSRRRNTPDGRAEAVRIETVSTAHQLIQLGPAYLKAALNYKSDSRHWLAAGEGGAPQAHDATGAAPVAAWRQRLGRWISGSR